MAPAAGLALALALALAWPLPLPLALVLVPSYPWSYLHSLGAWIRRRPPHSGKRNRQRPVKHRVPEFRSPRPLGQPIDPAGRQSLTWRAAGASNPLSGRIPGKCHFATGGVILRHRG